MRTSVLRPSLAFVVWLIAVAVWPIASGPPAAAATPSQSGTARLDAGTPGYVLDDGYGRRTVDYEVHFDERFARPPGVAVALVHVEAAKPGERRISVKVKHVFEAGFVVQATTWGDAAIHAVEFDWTATPQ